MADSDKIAQCESSQTEKSYCCPALTKAALIISLAASLIIAFIYLTGANFSDETLFFLLWALRVSSIFVIVFSLFLLIYSIRNFALKPAPCRALAISLYFLSVLFGAGLIVFNSFIVAIAGGNI